MTTAIVSLDSQSAHYYARDGTPRHTVIAKNGTERPSHLGDAKKGLWVPSTTGIIAMADKPNLRRWSEEQVLLAALTLPRSPDEPEAAWVRRVVEDSRETARKAAERGTAIHRAIEAEWGGYADGLSEYEAHVDGATHAIYDWAGHPALKTRLYPLLSEQTFAHPMGYGGTVDLASPEYGLDFKTKDWTSADPVPTPYDEHIMQAAAYRQGLGMTGARWAICFVSRTEPGLAHIEELTEPQLERGWSQFKALLAYWVATKNYDPSWEE